MKLVDGSGKNQLPSDCNSANHTQFENSAALCTDGRDKFDC